MIKLFINIARKRGKAVGRIYITVVNLYKHTNYFAKVTCTIYEQGEI